MSNSFRISVALLDIVQLQNMTPASSRLSLLIPMLLLSARALQCAVASPLSEHVQLSLTTEQDYDQADADSDDDVPGPPAHMFEGDILITPKQFEDHYKVPTGLNEPGKAEESQVRKGRGTIRERGGLWIDGVVYYKFHSSSVSKKERNEIERAIATIESLTCIRFEERQEEEDYVMFYSRKKDACSSYIGRTGGKQIVQLGPGCGDQGTILHEICHALGMWHEQSRPDRDDYVRVLTENVEEELLYNFMKRNIFDVDSLGTPYDYGSVMHYDLTSFAKEPGLQTLEISDLDEYERQGSPYVGYADTLSKIDVVQLNRLYNCPGSGVPGHLIVRIEKAENVKSMSQTVFVAVWAHDDSRREEFNATHPVDISSNNNPQWNEELDFGNRISWQYIQVGVWGYDPQTDEIGEIALYILSFSVNPGHHSRILCNGNDCSTILTFSITLTEDCVCLNGGTCSTDGDCACPAGYGGLNCEYPRGNLLVFIENGRQLLNADKSNGEGRSDVYVQVTAFDHYGQSKTMYTQTVSDSRNPVWNEGLDFGVNEWSWFTAQALDEDAMYDEWLSYAYTYPLHSHGSESIRLQAFRGRINFEYSFDVYVKV